MFGAGFGFGFGGSGAGVQGAGDRVRGFGCGGSGGSIRGLPQHEATRSATRRRMARPRVRVRGFRWQHPRAPAARSHHECHPKEDAATPGSSAGSRWQHPRAPATRRHHECHPNEDGAALVRVRGFRCRVRVAASAGSRNTKPPRVPPERGWRGPGFECAASGGSIRGLPQHEATRSATRTRMPATTGSSAGLQVAASAGSRSTKPPRVPPEGGWRNPGSKRGASGGNIRELPQHDATTSATRRRMARARVRVRLRVAASAGSCNTKPPRMPPEGCRDVERLATASRQ
jgi:hypothetical protein